MEWHTYEQVKEWLKKHTTGENPTHVILDEYDREVTFEFLIKLIDDKQNDKHYSANPDNFKYCKNVNGYRFSDSEFS